MRQRQPGRSPDIGLGDLTTTSPHGMCSRRSCGHDVGSHAVDLESPTNSGDGGQLPIIQLHRRQKRSSCDDPQPEFVFAGCIGGNEGCRIPVEGEPAPDHFCS
jgi:hypothetical protein